MGDRFETCLYKMPILIYKERQGETCLLNNNDII